MLCVGRVVFLFVIIFAVLGEAQVNVTRAVYSAGQRAHDARDDAGEFGELLFLEQVPQKAEIVV